LSDALTTVPPPDLIRRRIFCLRRRMISAAAADYSQNDNHFERKRPNATVFCEETRTILLCENDENRAAFGRTDKY
jgi:hypothetical protein